MSSLVSSDDRVRVVPRIFPDMPTQAEMAAVRKNRNTLAMYVVLLLGMLIAAGAGLVYFYLEAQGAQTGETADLAGLRQEREQVITNLRLDSAPNIGRLDDVIAERIAGLQSQIDTLTDQNEDLQEQIASLDILEEEYGTIHTRRVDAARLKAEIAELLGMPAYSTVRTDGNVSLTTYDSTFDPWKESLEARLLDYRRGLQSEKDAILRWRPLPAGQSLRVPDEPPLP